jgi:hypothetical protein
MYFWWEKIKQLSSQRMDRSLLNSTVIIIHKLWELWLVTAQASCYGFMSMLNHFSLFQYADDAEFLYS